MKITLAVRIALAGLGLSLLAGGPALAAPAQHAVETTTDRVPAVSARVAAVSSPGVVAPRRAAKGGRATVRYLGNRFVGRVRAPGACDSKRTVVARVGPRRLGKARSNRRGRFVVGTAPTHGLVTVIVRKRAGCRPIKRTTRIDAPSLSSKDTTSGVAGVLAAAPASCMRRRSVSVTLDGAPAGSASTTRRGTYAFSTTTPGRYRAAASSTRRCEGVTSMVAVKRTPVAESVVDRVEVVAEPLFFTAPGQSSSVGVAAFDAAGEPVPVASGDVSWASSDPGVVSAAAGVVRSRAANGSAEIVAMVDGVESEPVIAVVTPVTEETTLLDDPAIDVESAELVPVVDLETDADGLPDISIVLTLPTAPVVGEILLAVGDIPLGGRVVSAQSLGLGRYRVVLAPVGVEEALPDLTIDESVDLSGDLGPTPEDNPEVFEETIDPSAAEPAAGPAGASRGTPRTAASRAPVAAGPTPGPFTGEPRVVYDKPPVKCELEGTGVNAPPFQLTMDKPLKLNIKPELDVDFRNGELQRLAVDVSGSLAVQASVKFTAQADVKLQCKAQAGKTIVGFLKKIPGLRSLISGNIDFGKGFSFEIKALGPGITATAGASFVFNDASWGFERDPETDQVVVIDDSDEDLIKELKPITTFSPTNVADSSFNFRLSPVAADVFAYADFKAAPGALSGPIGDRIFDNSKGDDKTTIAGGKIGSRLQASLDDLGDELADPTFRSTYEWLAGAQFKVGVTKTIRTLIRMFGVRELSLFELKAMPEIFVSPRDATLAVAGIDRHPDSLTHPDFSEDRVFADDVVHLRGRIEEGIFWQNIIVTPPVPLPTFNIDAVRLVTLGADGDVDTLVEQEVDFTAPPIDTATLPSVHFVFDFDVTGYTGNLGDIHLVADTVFPAQLVTPTGPVLPPFGWSVEVARAGIDNRPPTADFTIEKESESGDGDRTVILDGSASTDPDGQVVSWLWDFGDGQVEETLTPTTTHTYSEDGDYDVTLTVTDDRGETARLTRAITIIHTDPITEAIYWLEGTRDAATGGLASSRLMTVPTDGAEPSEIDFTGAEEMVLSPEIEEVLESFDVTSDGRYIAASTSEGDYILDLVTEETRQLTGQPCGTGGIDLTAAGTVGIRAIEVDVECRLVLFPVVEPGPDQGGSVDCTQTAVPDGTGPDCSQVYLGEEPVPAQVPRNVLLSASGQDLVGYRGFDEVFAYGVPGGESRTVVPFVSQDFCEGDQCREFGGNTTSDVIKSPRAAPLHGTDGMLAVLEERSIGYSDTSGLSSIALTLRVAAVGLDGTVTEFPDGVFACAGAYDETGAGFEDYEVCEVAERREQNWSYLVAPDDRRLITIGREDTGFGSGDLVFATVGDPSAKIRTEDDDGLSVFAETELFRIPFVLNNTIDNLRWAGESDRTTAPPAGG